MGIFSGAWNVATNAIGAAEFGTKGVIIGAGVGLGTELLINQIGDEDDKNSVGTQFKRGFVSGSVASAFSTFQEQYAFKYPNRIQALTSINTTTTASSMTDATDMIFSKQTVKNAKDIIKNSYKDIKKNKEIPKEKRKSNYNIILDNSEILVNEASDVINSIFRPQNMAIDIAKQGMSSNVDFGNEMLKIFHPFAEEPSDEILNNLDKLSNDKDSFLSAFKKEYGFTPNEEDLNNIMNSTKNKKDFYENGLSAYENLSVKDKNLRTVKEAGKFYKEGFVNSFKNGNGEDGTSPWLIFTKDVTIPAEIVDGKVIKKEVKINASDSMEERLVKYLDRNREGVSDFIKGMEEFNDFTKELNSELNLERSSGIYNTDELIEYIKNVKPGALGTHKELSKNSNSTKRKIISALYEETNGSPLWAIATQKQIDEGAAKITDTMHVMRNGEKVSIPHNEYKKLNGDKFISRERAIKGGSKGMRALAMAGDIALGGLLQGIMFATPALITAPFRNGGSDKRINTINSNNAINPVY